MATAHSTVGDHDKYLLPRVAEATKKFLYDVVENAFKEHPRAPAVWSFQNDGTPIQTTEAITGVLDGAAVRRSY